MTRNSAVPVLALMVAATSCARHTISPVDLIPQTRLGAAQDYTASITGMSAYGITFVTDTPAQVIVLRMTNLEGIEQVQPRRSADRSELARGRHAVQSESFMRTNNAAQSAQRAAYAGYLACTPPFAPDASRAAPAGVADTSRRAAASSAIAQRRYDDCIRREKARETIFQRQGSAPLVRPEFDDVGYWLVIVSDAPTNAGELDRRLQTMDLSDTPLLDVVRALPEALVAGRTAHWAAYYAAFSTPSHR